MHSCARRAGWLGGSSLPAARVAPYRGVQSAEPPRELPLGGFFAPTPQRKVAYAPRDLIGVFAATDKNRARLDIDS